MDDFQVDTHHNLNTSVTIYKLAEVIRARVEEILSMVKAEYDKATKGQVEVFRVVITGGGSQLRGLKELSNKIFENRVESVNRRLLPVLQKIIIRLCIQQL